MESTTYVHFWQNYVHALTKVVLINESHFLEILFYTNSVRLERVEIASGNQYVPF